MRRSMMRRLIRVCADCLKEFLATNESSMSNSSLNKSESFQDVVSDPETSDPHTKRLKQRAIGFESSWKQDFTCLTEVEGICKRASAK
ncbi:hypothetical protein DPMN_081209 [Dreissena polymorpha]|uniref:Uncharacterized protein n=1 Tax=Dreissena polymorpha TaxID=45954 RepID=A0A9D3Y8K6_DREPO|nr:hypothetical protein DPMN_081209 [Dreissena polymorpha]